jgi:Xaa-Pro aminopeptidase
LDAASPPQAPGLFTGYGEFVILVILYNMRLFAEGRHGETRNLSAIERLRNQRDKDLAVLSERLNAPVSTGELERRWRLARAAMRDAGIDVLFMQNNNDHMGGYVGYFTDVPATNGYPVELVFPADDEMSVVCMGPFEGIVELGPEGDTVWRGVKRVYHTPAFVTAAYTRTYGADLAAEALKPYAKATIGLDGTMQIGAATLDYLRSECLSEPRFIDATDLVDRIKAVKSAEEQVLIRTTATLQDEAMGKAFEQIRRGMRDREVAAIVPLRAERERAGHLSLRLGAGGHAVRLRSVSFPEPGHSGG